MHDIETIYRTFWAIIMAGLFCCLVFGLVCLVWDITHKRKKWWANRPPRPRDNGEL